MHSGSPIRSGGWTRCNPHNLGAGRRAVRPPAPASLDRALKEIRSGGWWVGERNHSNLRASNRGKQREIR
eukprot:6188308-Pleurochrysis_carterae.AAC.1